MTCLTALRLRCRMPDGAKRFATHWRHRARNETARLRGGPHVRQSRGMICSSRFKSSPKTCPLVKRETAVSRKGGALPTCVTPLQRASPPEGERMSFCDQMGAAIDGARTLTRLDHLSRSIWQGVTAGAVADDDAQALAERLHARRSVLRGEIKPVGLPPGRPSIFPPRRPQRAPKRLVAIARRRHLAASGPMPPALACKFTVSELAVLRIIGNEVRQHGQCDRCVDEIAARAGVCRRMVQNAIREAARLGLLAIEERRCEGRRNLPNVIRIISKEWTSWLARGGRSTRLQAEPLRGCKKLRPTDKDYKTQHSRVSEPVFAAREQQAGSAAH